MTDSDATPTLAARVTSDAISPQESRGTSWRGSRLGRSSRAGATRSSRSVPAGFEDIEPVACEQQADGRALVGSVFEQQPAAGRQVWGRTLDDVAQCAQA